MPTPMARVLIAGPRTFEREAIDLLYEKRALHIHDFVPRDGEAVFKLGTPLEGADRASGLLIKLRSFKTSLGLEEAPPAADLPQASAVLPKIEASVIALEMSITSAADDRAKLESQVAELKARVEELRPFEPLAVPLPLLSGYGALAVFTGTAREGFEAALLKVVRHLEVLSGEGGTGLQAIFVDAESRDAAVKTLLEFGFQEARVPRGELSANEEIQAIEAMLYEGEGALVEKLKAKEKELETLKEKHADFILAATELLEMEVERCETPLRAATSTNTFVLEGFVPAQRVEDLREGLEKASRGRIHFASEPVPQLSPPSRGHGGAGRGEGHGESAEGHEGAADESTPVALKNPRAASPFEYLVNLISLPKYNEIDPTMLMFVVYPIFFGIMLGDIGYGAAVVFMGWLASRQRNEDLRAVGKLLIYGGFVSVFFGVVFGEFFGFEVWGSEGGRLNVYPHDLFAPSLVGIVPGFDGYFPISRLHGVTVLLSMVIWIGVIHILFGMLLGFRNQYRQHGLAHAVYAKGSWLLILVSGVVLIRTMLPVLLGGADAGPIMATAPFQGSLAVFFVGFGLLLKGEGVVGALELPSLLGNVLSYSRLLAIGLSGVAIALTANQPLEWAIEQRTPLAIIAGGALAVLGHLLGIFLGILGPGLHALRLHYVEFFTKFYEGGGEPFKPLGREPQYVAA